MTKLCVGNAINGSLTALTLFYHKFIIAFGNYTYRKHKRKNKLSWLQEALPHCKKILDK